ncbi:MAG: SDR family NAD(P)-dependent oxidoreductase [Hyphomicrobiaceae bacterium]
MADMPTPGSRASAQSIRGSERADHTLSLEGQVAIVTGASSGLGAHFARVLAKNGAHVAVCARRMDRIEALAAEITQSGGVALPVPMDVTETHSVDDGFAAIERAIGPISIVINNAGVPSQGRFVDLDDAAWRLVLDVNLDGVFRVARAGARAMLAHGGGGAIVNVASILGLGVLRGVAPYATSKAAVIQLTKAMALELARSGIRVNALAPGYVSTELNAEFLASEAGQRLRARVPMQQFGRLDDLDGPLLLLAGPGGRFMTGSVLCVDGGHALSLG